MQLVLVPDVHGGFVVHHKRHDDNTQHTRNLERILRNPKGEVRQCQSQHNLEEKIISVVVQPEAK